MKTPRQDRAPAPATPAAAEALARRHVAVGWRSLFVWATLGFALEGLHAWKAGWYLGPAAETRRLLWTLAHAHGVLLGVLNLGFAATIDRVRASRRRFASNAFVLATVLLPAGFLLGGAVVHAGDPGVGIALAPAGAIALLVALGAVAW